MDFARLSFPLACLALALSGYAAATATSESAGARAAKLEVLRPGAPAHVMFPVQNEPGNSRPNHVVSLSSNWDWYDQQWLRPNPAAPSLALSMETFFHGLGELNLDMQPPDGATEWLGGRAMGVAATYDGSYSTLFLGGPPYNPAAAGIKVTGGLTSEPILTVQEAAASESVLRVMGTDNQPHIFLHGGESPALSFGLGGERADHVGDGVMRVYGALGGQSLINVVAPGEQSSILAVRERLGEPPRVSIRADGRIEWNDVGGEPVSLARSNDGLMVDGTIASSALRVGDGSIVRGIRMVALDIAPDSVPKGAVRAQSFEAHGVTSRSLVFASAPPQPAGLALTGASVNDRGQVNLEFVNLGNAAAKPAAGRYTLLVIDADAQ